jgi:hypothetical protein
MVMFEWYTNGWKGFDWSIILKSVLIRSVLESICFSTSSKLVLSWTHREGVVGLLIQLLRLLLSCPVEDVIILQIRPIRRQLSFLVNSSLGDLILLPCRILGLLVESKDNFDILKLLLLRATIDLRFNCPSLSNRRQCNIKVSIPRMVCSIFKS